MRLALLLLTGAIAAAHPSIAAVNWTPVATSPDDPYNLYIDEETLVREGPSRLFIAEMVPVDAPDMSDSSGLASVLVRVKIDCSANMIRTQSAMMLDEDGDATDLTGAAPRAIKAGTDDMMLKKTVC
jgi:hypothetical protein